MSGRVVIVDYGSGNLRSVAKAFERAVRDSARVDEIVVTSDTAELNRADRIVLPGVGAFGDCMAGLARMPGMLGALKRNVRDAKKPFLGICVGMQLMAERSSEHGSHSGLGWLTGDVGAVRPDDQSLKIPHMGWNELELVQESHPMLAGIRSGAHVYFVHSFAFYCTDDSAILARIDYGGHLVAIVGRDNIVGTQFHPEKSQLTGLTFLRNFLAWRP